MSKTKSLKKKTTGFDILYRVVTAIMAVAMFPLVFFMDILYIQVDHTAIADIWGSLTSDKTPNLGSTYENLSIYELGDWVETVKGFFGENSDSAGFFEIGAYRPLIAAIVFLGIALILGLVILGFAAFSNKIKVIMGLSGGGILASIISYFCFTEGFAAPIIRGDVTLSNLFGQGGNVTVELILSAVGEVSALALKGGFFAVLLLMLGILLWSISVYIVNAGEEKEKQMKKAK